MKRNATHPLVLACAAALLAGCAAGLPTAREAGLSFATVPSALPGGVVWREIGRAKELINRRARRVVIGGGSRPMPDSVWATFSPRFPWAKNLERHLLFDSTCFYRSPGRPAACQGEGCIAEVAYGGYTWVSLAEPVCVDFIPAKTDLLRPAKGHLVVKTIRKCQAVMFRDSIFQLTDHRGNYYAMHAYEEGGADTSAVLPPGWTLRLVRLAEPLVITPFGGGDACYFNIVGDHLGQGYHQYAFADSIYPPPRR